jgi:hypothetical protein
MPDTTTPPAQPRPGIQTYAEALMRLQDQIARGGTGLNPQGIQTPYTVRTTTFRKMPRTRSFTARPALTPLRPPLSPEDLELARNLRKPGPQP